MRPGVRHHVFSDMVGQTGVVIPPEGVLKDRHPGQCEVVSKASDRGRDRSQIFRDERRPVEILEEGFEQLSPRRSFPASPAGVSCACSDMPGMMETDEVVDPDQVEPVELDAYPSFPPGEVRSLVHPPSIVGVLPELSVPTEAVGWDSGDHRGSTLSIELKELRVGDDVGGFQRHEDRQIPEDPDPTPSGMGAQCIPLSIQHELDERVIGLGAPTIACSPTTPVIQPEGRAFHETAEWGASVPSKLPETLPGRTQSRFLETTHACVVDPSFAESAGRSDRRSRQQSINRQILEREEDRLDRETRGAAVGRVSLTQGTDRKHLPDRPARDRQPVDESTCRRAEVSDAVSSVQRTHVQQDPR